MNITDSKFTFPPQKNNGPVLAYVDFIIDHALLIHDARIIQGPNRVFLAMPSIRKQRHCPACNGKNPLNAKFCSDCGIPQNPQPARHENHRDIIHPVLPALRTQLEQALVLAFHEAKAKAG